MGEEPPVGVQQGGNGVRIGPGTESADVQFEQRGHLLQKMPGARAHTGVVPRGTGAVQLKVVHSLETRGKHVRELPRNESLRSRMG